MKLTDIHRILGGRETKIALLIVFRNGSGRTVCTTAVESAICRLQDG